MVRVPYRTMKNGFSKLLVVLVALSIEAGFAFSQQLPAVSNNSVTGRSVVIPEAWPSDVSIQRLSDIGKHKAVIFSPDFAQPGNREFYEKLGFLYIQNYWHPENQIETIILETHGTNGNGLKLQSGPFPRSPRSYISIGGLQEKLEGLGVKLCVIGACNSGRLFRPEIYKELDPHPGDRLFLPPTLGIINASPKYDPAKSKMVVVRRAESEIETTSDGDTSELSPVARMMLGLGSKPGGVSRSVQFAVSNILVQLLTHDPRLKLTAEGYENDKSRNDLTEDESDELFQRFVAFIDDVAAHEYQFAHAASPTNTGRSSQDEPQSQTTRPRTTPAGSEKKPARRVID